MASTENTYTGNGLTTQYDIDFPYLRETDVKVTLDEVLQTSGYTHDLSTDRIIFTTAPASSVAIRIFRDTDVDTLAATFFSGSSFRAKDLNDNFKQHNFRAQEIDNNTWDKSSGTVHSTEPWQSNDNQIATTAAMDARFQDEFSETITSSEVWPDNDDTIATTAAIDNRIDTAITNDIAGSDGVSITDDGDGTITVGLSQGSVDFDRIKPEDIITEAEQNLGPTVNDSSLFTSGAASKRFDTLVQTATPTATDYPVGKTWLQNDDDLTLSVWNGSGWIGLASGGTFTNQPKVVYVDATAGDDANNGHRISRPKKTIRAAIAQINADSAFGDGSVVSVAPGIYAETLPIDIQKNDVGIIGQSLRTCIIHPAIPAADQGSYDVDTPHAQELTTMFRVNSGSYFQNLTLTGMKASGSRGASGSLYENSTYGLPPNQGWNFAFYPGAVIKKSPYIQNCTNFSDSQINNVTFTPHIPNEGAAGDLDSAPTGGGILVDGSVPSTSSPLRSIVCDSYTHTALDGPGIFVTNNGYMQATSSYAFFNHAHITCINGGQANLAASTTDFGRYALLVSGKSTSAIFTSTVDGAASNGAVSFDIKQCTAGTGWFGDAQRPATNMVVEVNSIVYPILSATPRTDSEGNTGFTVTISRPDPNNRSTNLGLNGALTDNASVSFFLRSMIASSGHTMEYVGSGTDYNALPENGGVPDESKQKTELNGGKIWTATTDHNGKFTIGGNQSDVPIFTVNQETGFVTIPTGSISFELASDASPQLAAALDAQSNKITSLGTPTADSDAATKAYVDNFVAKAGDTMSGNLAMGTNKITGLGAPSADGDAATKKYVDDEISDLVDSSPDTLNTLNELAAALNDDDDFATTVTNSIATKLSLAGGQMTGNVTCDDTTASGNVTFDGRDLSVDGTKLDSIEANAEVNVDTNLTATIAADKITVQSSTGTNVDLPLATLSTGTNKAGLISPAEKTKLDGLPASVASSITDLSDVDTSSVGNTPSNGDGLVWNSSDSEWQPGQLAQQNADWTATSGVTQILNKPSLASVATSGSYADLSNTPTIPTNNNQLTNGAGYITSFDITTQTDDKYVRADQGDDKTGDLNILSGELLVQTGGNNTYGVIKGYNNDNHFLGIRCNVANQSSLSITAANKTSFVEYAQNDDSTGWYWLSSHSNYGEIMRLTKTGGLKVFGNSVLTTADEGSGNGLDADTVDGVHASSFLRSDQSTTLTSGSLTLNSGNITANNGSNKQIYLNAGDGAIEITRSAGGAYIDFKNSTSEDHDARLQQAGSSLNLNGNRILTTADEGSGNGLDADTVDGIQGADILECSYQNLSSGNFNSYTDNKIRKLDNLSSGFSNQPASYGWGMLRSTQFASSSYVVQEFIPHQYDGVWIRVNWGGTWTDWRETLTSHSQQVVQAANDNEWMRLRSSSYSSDYLYLGGWSSTNSNDIARIRVSGNLHIDSPANGDLYLNHYSNKAVRTGDGDLISDGNFYLNKELNMTLGGSKNRYIDADLGSNTLYIRGTTSGDSGHINMARFRRGYGAALYYNGTERLSTASDGAVVDSVLTVNSRVVTDEIRCKTGQQVRINVGESAGKYSPTDETCSIIAETGLRVTTPDRAHGNWDSGYSLKHGLWTGDKLSVGYNGVPTGNLADSNRPAIIMGDSDTGFRWLSDGIFDVYCNNQHQARFQTSGTTIYDNLTVTGTVNGKTVLADGVLTSTLSGSTPTWTGIPSTATRIVVAFRNVRHSTSDELMICIGNGSAQESGYESASTNQTGSVKKYDTTGFMIDTTNNTALQSGMMIIERCSPTTRSWFSHHNFTNGTSGGLRMGSGSFFCNHNSVDRIRLSNEAKNGSFAAGSITIWCE